MPVYDESSFTHGLRSVQIYQRGAPVAGGAGLPGLRSRHRERLAVLTPRPAGGAGPHGRAALLAGDIGSKAAAATPDATWADTDGNQRRDSGYGSIRNDQSYVLGPNQRSPIAQPAVPQNLAVVSRHRSTRRSPSRWGRRACPRHRSPPRRSHWTPLRGPSAAFDDNLATAWVADAKDNSVGQWVQIDFGRGVDLQHITVRPLADGAQRPKVTGIEISTARGTVERTIHRRRQHRGRQSRDRAPGSG